MSLKINFASLLRDAARAAKSQQATAAQRGWDQDRAARDGWMTAVAERMTRHGLTPERAAINDRFIVWLDRDRAAGVMVDSVKFSVKLASPSVIQWATAWRRNDPAASANLDAVRTACGF